MFLNTLNILMATWNENFNNLPTDNDAGRLGAQKIRETRVELFNRITKEHQFDITNSYHLEGSARGYVAGTAPTLRPDGSTSLNAIDQGRVWFDSSRRYDTYTWDASWTRVIGNEASGKQLFESTFPGTIPSNTTHHICTNILQSNATWNMDSALAYQHNLPSTIDPYAGRFWSDPFIWNNDRTKAYRLLPGSGSGGGRVVFGQTGGVLNIQQYRGSDFNNSSFTSVSGSDLIGLTIYNLED